MTREAKLDGGGLSRAKSSTSGNAMTSVTNDRLYSEDDISQTFDFTSHLKQPPAWIFSFAAKEPTSNILNPQTQSNS